MTDTDTAIRPLTVLTEDESMFRDAVRDFARSEVGPRVQERRQQRRRTLPPEP